MRAYIADVVNCVAYYIVASIVRNMLAVIIMMKFALNVVELAVFDENPGGFAEQLFESFNHLTRTVCALGLSSNTSLFISLRGLYMDRVG